jgi:2-polyprenyl-6-methoxyphenol hydroxylase-like FAD-dependent oxidoreductase
MDDVETAERVDVVIVGAGPTGLTAAHSVAGSGCPPIVLERRDGPQRSPAAHVVNARTFEIWRQAGVDMEPVLDQCLPPEEAGEVHWVTKLGGDVVGSLPFERQGDEMLASPRRRSATSASTGSNRCCCPRSSMSATATRGRR